MMRRGAGIATAGIVGAAANVAALGAGVAPGSIDHQVASSAGDGHAPDGSGGTPNITDNHVECRSNTSIWHRRIGWVFEGVQIPSGATIDSAVVRAHHINSAAYRDQYGTLYGEDTDDAPLIQEVSGDLWRTLTSASVSWQTTLVQNDWNDSPDISAIIQEIIDRPGWAKGNNVCILDVPSHAVNYQARYIAYDNVPADACRLVVSWS